MRGILRHHLPLTADEIAFFGDWMQFLGQDVVPVQLPDELQRYLRERYQ